MSTTGVRQLIEVLSSFTSVGGAEFFPVRRRGKATASLDRDLLELSMNSLWILEDTADFYRRTRRCRHDPVSPATVTAAV